MDNPDPIETLRARMKRRDMCQSDLARELDVTRSCISRWMLGKSRPSRTIAARLEKVLGVPRAVWA